jgi:hypothetical protein
VVNLLWVVVWVLLEVLRNEKERKFVLGSSFSDEIRGERKEKIKEKGKKRKRKNKKNNDVALTWLNSIIFYYFK